MHLDKIDLQQSTKQIHALKNTTSYNMIIHPSKN